MIKTEKFPLVAGVEDGSFLKFKEGHGKTLLVCTLMEGRQIVDVRAREITVDGLDATKMLIDMLQGSNFDCLFLSGISYAGFNLIDPVKIHSLFNRPIIIVSLKKPNNVAVYEALRSHFRDWKRRWAIIEKLGIIYETTSFEGEPPIYLELIGIELEQAKNIIKRTCICCRIPEPIRAARIIARGLTKYPIS